MRLLTTLSEKLPWALFTTVSMPNLIESVALTALLVGQTPRKLFSTPHPDRMMHGASSMPIGNIYGIPEDYHLLSQTTRVVKGMLNFSAT